MFKRNPIFLLRPIVFVSELRSRRSATKTVGARWNVSFSWTPFISSVVLYLINRTVAYVVECYLSEKIPSGNSVLLFKCCRQKCFCNSDHRGLLRISHTNPNMFLSFSTFFSQFFSTRIALEENCEDTEKKLNNDSMFIILSKS